MYVVSTGMVCPVGLNAKASCAAMRAGISRFIELPYHDNQDKPIIGAMVPGFSTKIKWKDRLIDLLSMALSDCLQGKVSVPLENVPLLVGLAEQERPSGAAGLAGSIIRDVEVKLGVRFHPKLSRAFPNGHTSSFKALGIARQLFQDPSVSACLVCGVDSYIKASSLLWLDQHWRLKTDKNSDGVIPGEAAGAVWLQPAPDHNTKPNIKVIGLGFGYEKASVLSEDPLLGRGLTEATRAALAEAKIQMHDIGFRSSDVTGESYGFKEQGIAEMKLMRIHREAPLPLWHNAESIGDTGAAVGVCQIVISFHAFRKGYAPGSSVLCSTSAVSGERAVAALRVTK